MSTVNSVLGPMDTSDMGFTLSHEHVLITSAGIQATFPEFVPRDEAITEGIQIFKDARAGGLQTIFDLTTHDLGRDIKVVEAVSKGSGVNIIAATGTWRDIPRVFWTAEIDDIAALYVRELEEGIEGTGIRPGIIKVANDIGGVTPEGEIVLRAAARAHQKTGAPIYTHTWAPERVGDQQVKIFEDEGVDLNRVCVGHSNDTTDLDYLKGLLDKGVWIGMDRYHPIARPGVPDWKTRTETTKALIDAGYADRLMLGHDAQVRLLIASREAFTERMNQNPDKFLFISRNALPYLKEIGGTYANVHSIMVDNPRRYMEGAS
jgi:phosphotriesterase-related protein